jgi:chromosome segregation ATPase
MASTDEKRPAAAAEVSQALPDGARSERRRHVQEVLSVQRQSLDRLENDLAHGLRALGDEISRNLAEGGPAAPDLKPQLDELNRLLGAERAELERHRAGWEQARIDLGRLEQELRVREVLLREAQAQQEQRLSELAMARDQLVEARTQASVANERQEQLRRELAERQQQAVAAEEETTAQRRRIARQFKIQHAEHLAQLEQRKAELDELSVARGSQLESQLAASQAQAQQSAEEVKQLRSLLEGHGAEAPEAQARIASLEAEIVELRDAVDEARAASAQAASIEERAEANSVELKQARAEAASLAAEVAQLRAALEQAEAVATNAAEELTRSTVHRSVDREEWTKLQSEHDRLATELQKAQRRLEAAAAAKPAGDDDLQRRLEMAVEETRELKRANSDLEAKLKSRGATPTAAPAAGGGLDWEAQKQRLLASLEADDSDDEEAIAERQSIEKTIRITDEVLAKKEEEIAALKEQLETQPVEPAATARANDEALDGDETIREEREKLRALQEEWRTKIGKAEIEISIERAKIGRERAELAEKMQLYGQVPSGLTATGEPAEPVKPGRGRWLSMLGLKEDDKPEK